MNYHWTHVDTTERDFFEELSEAFAKFEQQYPNAFPDFHQSSDIYVLSDYSGDAKSARFEALGFLFMTPKSARAWNKQRNQVRKNYLYDDRTISYKKLNDQRRKEALLPFLMTANQIDGLVAVVLIDKKVRSLFASDERELAQNPNYKSLVHWPPKVLEKALRVTNFVSFFLNGLGEPEQNLLWISDQDSIIPNEDRRQEFHRLFDSVASQYPRIQPNKVGIGTTSINIADNLLEDLVAIPDLVAGALVHVITEWSEYIEAIRLGISIPVPASVQPKTRRILKWLEDESQELKRFFLVIDEGPDKQGLQAFVLKFHTEQIEI